MPWFNFLFVFQLSRLKGAAAFEQKNCPAISVKDYLRVSFCLGAAADSFVWQEREIERILLLVPMNQSATECQSDDEQ